MMKRAFGVVLLLSTNTFKRRTQIARLHPTVLGRHNSGGADAEKRNIPQKEGVDQPVKSMEIPPAASHADADDVVLDSEIQPEWLALERRVAQHKPKPKGETSSFVRNAFFLFSFSFSLLVAVSMNTICTVTT